MKAQHEKAIELGKLTLRPGERYRVTRAFEDYDGKLHPAGEAWVFLGYDFSPYHGGFTFHVAHEAGTRGVIRMQEDSQEAILSAFEGHVGPVGRA